MKRGVGFLRSRTRAKADKARRVKDAKRLATHVIQDERPRTQDTGPKEMEDVFLSLGISSEQYQ